ncbi:MAG: flavodoxin family protein [Candidatus Deferrimicrobiaceae bacterium]
MKNGNQRELEISRLLVEEICSLGHSADLLNLEGIRIAPCTGCFGCWVKTPGACVIDDPGRDVARAALHCDLLVFLTPITFGGYSSELKKAVDRLIPLLSPYFVRIGEEIHHRARYPKYPPILGVGLLPVADPEQERIFRTLVGRNAVNYHSPFHMATVIGPGGEETLRRDLRDVIARCGGR